MARVGIEDRTSRSEMGGYQCNSDRGDHADDGQSGEPSVARQKRRPPMLPPMMLGPISWPMPALQAEAIAAADMLKERPAAQLRVMTWNVWFDSLCAAQRQWALLREVLGEAPDVICLQEVLPEFAAVLRNSPDLGLLYDVSPQDVRTYGCAMLVRRDFRATFQEQQLPSNMGRTLLTAECTERCPGLYIMNTHLESLNTRSRREQQLRLAAEALQDHPLSVFCGDFNFDDTKTWGEWSKRFKPRSSDRLSLENEILREVLPTYSDTWREIWPDDAGYTFDGQENGVCIADPQERMRYDRILARIGQLKPTAAKLHGRAAINDWGVRPSDHFGLSVDMDVCSMGQSD